MAQTDMTFVALALLTLMSCHDDFTITRASPVLRPPYHGYLFHVLTRQGKHAAGGAMSYIVNGKMTEGFALVAYPAEYRSSGVMTFIVNSDGVVYQKDLGKKTEALGKVMKEYNLGSTWRKAEDFPEVTASQQEKQ